MGHIFKWLGSKDQAKQLWENKEALEMYIARLRDFWDEDGQCWRETQDVPRGTHEKAAGGSPAANISTKDTTT